MPGSKSILIESELSFSRVNFSMGQLNGGSIFKVIVVASGPIFLITSSLVIGADGTPLTQRYLKSSFGKLNCRIGVIKLPNTLQLNTGLGLRSLPITA